MPRSSRRRRNSQAQPPLLLPPPPILLPPTPLPHLKTNPIPKTAQRKRRLLLRLLLPSPTSRTLPSSAKVRSPAPLTQYSTRKLTGYPLIFIAGLISHHLPDSTVISPSLSEAAASAAITIHDQIENRPLSKQKAAHPAHPHPHHPPMPPTAETMIDLDALDGTEKHEDEESEDEGEREAVLKDDDRELDRVFDVSWSWEVTIGQGNTDERFGRSSKR